MSSICRIISKYIGSCAHQQRCSSLLKSSRQTGLCSIIAYSDKCGSKKGSDSSGSKKGKEPSEPCPPPCPCNPCPCNPNPCDPWCCNPCPPCPPCPPCDNEPVAYSTMYDRRKYGHNLPANNVNVYFPPLACFPTGVFRDTDCEVLGLGAGKCGFYKNPEYFSYHHMSYYDMHLLIRPFRRPAPETNRKP